MKQKKIKFEMKPFSWDHYENGVPELTPEQKKLCDEMNLYFYGTTKPLWK